MDAIRGIEACGMTVPDDYPLTTEQQNTRMAGELLVDNLLKMIEGEKPESFLLPTDLIARRSCGARL